METCLFLGGVLFVFSVTYVMEQRRNENMTMTGTDQLLRKYSIANAEYLDRIDRLQRIRDACADKMLFSNKPPVEKQIYYFSPQYNFSYCKVPKAGSSFWTQVFTVLRDGASIADKIFGMRRAFIHARLRPYLEVKFGQKVRQSRSILVSRDPYSRLFSTFVDKVFIPGKDKYAVEIMTRQRNILDAMHTCANDVTFQEFLNDILECYSARKPMDRHWAPIIALCKPCSVNVFALVKQETFARDVEYVLKEIGVSIEVYKAIYDALHNHRVEATIPGIVETYLNRASNNKTGCLTQVDVARRLWNSFQIQGFIREEIPFPSNIINTKELERNDTFLTDVILNTIRENPMTSEESRRQRRRALVAAFANISKTTIDGLKQAYKQDFVLFDYPIEPPK